MGASTIMKKKEMVSGNSHDCISSSIIPLSFGLMDYYPGKGRVEHMRDGQECDWVSQPICPKQRP